PALLAERGSDRRGGAREAQDAHGEMVLRRRSPASCYGPAMPAFPCPYCGHALVSDADADADAKLGQCPSCDGTLLIAYRYRLVCAHAKVSGGLLYDALDDVFDHRVAVLFVED